MGRNSAPPGSFREIYGSSEPGDHCAHFELLIDFFCLRAKIGQNWAKLGLKLGRNPVLPLLGTFLAVTRRHRGVFREFLAHQKRARIAHILYRRDCRWFGLLRPQLAIDWFLGGLRDEEISQHRWGPEMAILALTRRHRGVFGKFLSHRNRETVAHMLSC